MEKTWNIENMKIDFICYLFWILLGGVFAASLTGPTGVLGFVFVFPDKQVVVTPKGEHARRFDFLDDRLRNKSLQNRYLMSRKWIYRDEERKLNM